MYDTGMGKYTVIYYLKDGAAYHEPEYLISSSIIISFILRNLIIFILILTDFILLHILLIIIIIIISTHVLLYIFIHSKHGVRHIKLNCLLWLI